MNDPQELINLLTEAGFAYAVSAYSTSDKAGGFYVARLESLESFMHSRRLGQNAPTLSLLKKMGGSNVFKRDAFLQALVSIRSPEILAAAWRMIQGMSLQSFQIDFKYEESFSMRILLESPYGEPEEYKSQDIDDLAFGRHLMKGKTEGKPIINGFFATR